MKKTILLSVFSLYASYSIAQSISINPSNLQLPYVTSLPGCAATDYGKMVFLTTTNKSQVCQATGWVIMEASGAVLNIPINETADIPNSQLIYLSNSNGGANSIGMAGTATTTSGGIGVSGTAAAATPTNNTVGVYGGNASSVANTGIGVYGKHEGSGWGVYGQSVNGIGVEGNIGTPTSTTRAVIGGATIGNGVFGAVSGVGVAGKFLALANGIAGQFQAVGTTSRALFTNGALRFTGIGEAASKYLKTDNNGLATWANITREDELSIPPNALIPNDSQHLLLRGSTASLQVLASGTIGTIYAPVIIPNGATITSLKLGYLDNSTTLGILSCSLQTNPHTSNGFTTISLLTIPSTTSPIYQTLTSPVLSEVVNNDTNFYRIEILMNASTLVAITGIEIKYTFNVNN